MRNTDSHSKELALFIRDNSTHESDVEMIYKPGEAERRHQISAGRFQYKNI